MNNKNDERLPEIFSGMTSRLDLASEANSLLRGEKNAEIAGVQEDIAQFSHAKVTAITILNEQGAEIMGRPIGKYITIDAPDIRFDKHLEAEISSILADVLRRLLPPNDGNRGTILLIGLGNNHATPDSLGPTVIDFTVATRHLIKYSPEEIGENLSPLCTLAPGVLGITGIETAEIIKGVVSHVKPCCIIAVDSLAAASIKRVSTTIQIADTGINPGSGLGNKRTPIDKDTMGVPVIAIGVPTVVNTSVIIYETLTTLLRHWQEAGRQRIPHIDEETLAAVNDSLLSTFDGNMVVTPKEIDQLVFNISRIIAAGIAQAVHRDVDKSNYHLYIQ